LAFPSVAIVGRPNVGKSSFFNWLAGRRISIVDPTAGVTRDRISTLIEFKEHYFELVDTGGMGNIDVDNLTAHIENQISEAIKKAGVVLFLVDGRSGIVPADLKVAQNIRTYGKPVLIVVNKCDHEGMDLQATDFYQLGFPELICVSAQQKRNKAKIFEWLFREMPKWERSSGPEQEPLKIAIVGRRNTGKSTFINSLAEEERVIVSEVAGTTRDSVDVRFERDNKAFIAIDTAGVRKRRSVKGDIEFYSLVRAERSIRRADVVLLFLDPEENVSKVDKQLAEYILQFHKPAIFVVNKWDIITPKGIETGTMAKYLQEVFTSLDYVPIAFITAKTGRNVFPVLNLAQSLYKQSCKRVSTAQITKVINDAVEKNPPPLRQNRTPRIYFASQVDSKPPTIVLFTNGATLFDPPYLRYLLKSVRDNLAFNDVPIRLLLRGRKSGMVPIDPKTDLNYDLKPKAKNAPRVDGWNDADSTSLEDSSQLDSWDDAEEINEIEFVEAPNANPEDISDDDSDDNSDESLPSSPGKTKTPAKSQFPQRVQEVREVKLAGPYATDETKPKSGFKASPVVKSKARSKTKARSAAKVANQAASKAANKSKAPAKIKAGSKIKADSKSNAVSKTKAGSKSKLGPKARPSTKPKPTSSGPSKKAPSTKKKPGGNQGDKGTGKLWKNV